MYEAYFGLREPPFSFSPDPRFLWRSETHEEGLSALHCGISTGKGIILLTGGVGAGKTTLLHTALTQQPETTSAALITNTAGLTGLDLLTLVAAELGVRARRKSTAEHILAIKAFLLERFREGWKTVLAIDEAQSLSQQALEQLRLLSNLETNREKMLQIILAGQPELRRKLTRPGLRPLLQRIELQHHVEPLSPSELVAYLDHRLRVAGRGYAQIFEPGAESIFFGFSAGCPRLVNLLADQSLLSAFAKDIRPVPRILVETEAKALDEQRLDPLWEAEIWDA